MIELLQRLAGADPAAGLHFHGDRSDGEAFWPYPHVEERVRAFASRFRAMGITPGTRVIVPFETDPRVVFSFLGLMACGALPLSVKPLLGRAEAYADFLATLGSRFRVNRILDAPGLRNLPPAFERIPLPAVDAESDRAFLCPTMTGSDLAFVQFSSGSVSFPKGIPIRRDTLLANVRLITGHDRRDNQDVGSTWLPLYHDMGLIGGLLTPLWGGHSLHLYTPSRFMMDPVGWLSDLARFRVSITVMPNFGLEYCARSLARAGAGVFGASDFERLRLIYCGSEPISLAAVENFTGLLRPHGLRPEAFTPCYGMAEAVLMVSCQEPEAAMAWTELSEGRKLVTAGSLLRPFEARVMRDDGRKAADGELGEIELRGGTLAGAYFEDDRPFFNAEGYYATGDMGFFRDGKLYVAGRIGDRMKINGQSYFASDFEQAVDVLSFTRPGRTAVVQPDDRVVVLMEIRDGKVLAESDRHKAEIAEALLRATGVKVRIEDIHFVRYGQLERTSSGKLRRRAIYEAFMRGDIRMAR
jgi:fatty-acyl-CoA synthase